jgi:hypothetical protein
MRCYHDDASGCFVLVSILPTRHLNNSSTQISQLPMSASALLETRLLQGSRPRGGRGTDANGMAEGVASGAHQTTRSARRMVSCEKVLRSEPRRKPEGDLSDDRENKLRIQSEGRLAGSQDCRPGCTSAGAFAAVNSFNSALPLRNHGRSYRCIYRGSVRFFASSFCAHSRDCSGRPASLRKYA